MDYSKIFMFNLYRDFLNLYFEDDMLLGVFAVYDSGVSTWMAPLYFRNKGEALRWWQEIVNNPETKVSKHPGDYTLFELGSWNDESCIFNLIPAPVKLGTAIEFVKSAPVVVDNK